MSNTISLRMPLLFPEGNGSLRLDILVQKYGHLVNYTYSCHVYKQGRKIEEYQTERIFKMLKHLSKWNDVHWKNMEEKADAERQAKAKSKSANATKVPD